MGNTLQDSQRGTRVGGVMRRSESEIRREKKNGSPGRRSCRAVVAGVAGASLPLSHFQADGDSVTCEQQVTTCLAPSHPASTGHPTAETKQRQSLHAVLLFAPI
jgi:hypothetical protein